MVSQCVPCCCKKSPRFIVCTHIYNTYIRTYIPTQRNVKVWGHAGESACLNSPALSESLFVVSILVALGARAVWYPTLALGKLEHSPSARAPTMKFVTIALTGLWELLLLIWGV